MVVGTAAAVEEVDAAVCVVAFEAAGGAGEGGAGLVSEEVEKGWRRRIIQCDEGEAGVEG